MAPWTVERSGGLRSQNRYSCSSYWWAPGSGLEAQGVVLFLSCMPLGRKYVAIFTDVGCLALLHRKISKEASQGLSSLSPVPY